MIEINIGGELAQHKGNNLHNLKHYLVVLSTFTLITLHLMIGCSSVPFLKTGQNGESKAEIIISLGCQKEELGCYQLINRKGEKVWLKPRPRLALSVENAEVIKDLNSNIFLLAIYLSEVEKEIFFNFTKQFVGKIGALIFEGKVLFSSKIVVPVKDGALYFSLDENVKTTQAIQLCKELYDQCPTKIREIKKNHLQRGASVQFFDTKLINKHYSDVNESLFWYSPFENIVVYKDENFKEEGRFRSNVKLSTGQWFNAYFAGIQEYDSKKGKFIYNEKGIKLSKWGWVRRKDLLPGNVIRQPDTLKNELYSLELLQKCPQTFKFFINSKQKISKNSNLHYFNQIKDDQMRLIRDSTIGLCNHLGEKLCKEEINRLHKKTKQLSCNDLFLALNYQNMKKDGSEYKRMASACEKKNINSCLVLSQYERNYGDEEKVQKYLELGCQHGAGEICFNMAVWLSKKKSNKKNEEILNYFKKSCSFGYNSGCHQYAYLLYESNLKEKAMEIYQKACQKHNYQSCSNLGGILLSSNKKENALSYLEMACRFNNSTGCYNLACYYSLNQDIKASLLNLKKSMILGIPIDDWLIKKDPDLEFIRSTLEFNILVKEFSEK